jgi:hypothetical protein
VKIREVETNENYPVRRFQSEGGVWEWGIRPMLFGFRVTIGQCESPVLGMPTIEADYCTGPEIESALLWCGFISAIMLQLREDLPAPALNRLFPRQTVKPLYNDPACTKSLEELAEHLPKGPGF